MNSWDDVTCKDCLKLRSCQETMRIATEKLAKIAEFKERYIEAWIAATGLHPKECEIVQQTKGNEIIWFARMKT